ncbi:MAG: geranylgeranylglycerol-phosphate geranylgeranyltransferase [Bacteroidetes bacterium]|nr:geranylgeranylglycerol-phosphate geranylgeranyltransferase [Bacteroidota bacterium]
MVFSFLKLIRWPNLLIIAFTQYAIRWGVIYPVLHYVNSVLHQLYPDIVRETLISMQLSEFNFFLIVFSTVLIAAAGYIINDYFDVKLDRINKPDDVLIDVKISRRAAIMWHWVLNISALLIALYLGFLTNTWKIVGLIYFMCASGLWFYSTTFKKQFLIGNVLVALFTALVPILVGLFEIPLLLKKYGYLFIQTGIDISFMYKAIIAFSFFAFLTTLIRELIKDVQDIEGDKAYGCETLPIKWGIKKAKLVLYSLCVVTIGCIGYLMKSQYADGAVLSFYYLLFAVQVPLFVLIVSVFRSVEYKSFWLPSLITKVIMFLGVMYSAVIYISFVK